MTWETWWIYVLAYMLICVTPGPAVLFVTSQSAWRGRSAGIRAVFGIESANVVFWTLSALGLAAVIAASQTIFLMLKWAGVAYLAWLGIRAIAGSFAGTDARPEVATAAAHAYRDGLIVGLSNPKALFFFVALLPQFVELSKDALPQVIILAITGIVIDFSSNTAYAFAGGELRRVLARGRARRWFERSVGGMFLSLAALAALYRRHA